jgi:hypothetical protein
MPNRDNWTVNPDSAKATIAPSTDCLLGRLPVGTRVVIDIVDDVGDGRGAVVSAGVPDALGGWLHGMVGSVRAEFSSAASYGDHMLENALHDAVEELQARCAKFRRKDDPQ